MKTFYVGCSFVFALLFLVEIARSTLGQTQPIFVEHQCGALASERPQTDSAYRIQIVGQAPGQSKPAETTSQKAPGIALDALEGPQVIVYVGTGCNPCTRWLDQELFGWVHMGVRVMVVHDTKGPWPRFTILDGDQRRNHVGYLTWSQLKQLKTTPGTR